MTTQLLLGATTYSKSRVILRSEKVSSEDRRINLTLCLRVSSATETSTDELSSQVRTDTCGAAASPIRTPTGASLKRLKTRPKQDTRISTRAEVAVPAPR